MPVYNAGRYIESCIDSLLSQTYGNLEIITVNDGSSDDTAEKLSRYVPRITLIDQPNRGVAAARNRALEIASGDYILFLDADDYLEHDSVEKLVKHAAEKEPDIIKFRMCREYNDGTRVLEKPEFDDCFYITKEGFKKHIYVKFLSGISFNAVIRSMFRREVISGLRFIGSMKTAEDAIFAVHAYTRARSFLYLSGVYYHYRVSGQGLTGRGLSVRDKYKYNIMLVRELLLHLEKWDMNGVLYKCLALLRIPLITLSKTIRILKKH